MRSRLRSALPFLALLIVLLTGAPAVRADEAADLASARRLFEKNLHAIRDKDKDTYLSCYLKSDQLARTGPTGFELGYTGLAATTGQAWPDHIDAEDLRLTPVRPGVVYGTYRYRVRYGANEVAGISERFFLDTPQGWKIAVSTAFPTLPGVPPPPRALVGATLVDGTGAEPVRDAVVLVRNGQIDCAGPRTDCPVPDGMDTVDLKGQWITPGLIDSHVHFSQTGWADGRPDSIDLRAKHPYEEVVADLRTHPERFGRSWLCSGVTAVFDVGGYPWTLSLPAWAEPRTDVPRVAAAGPLLSTLDHWVNVPGERQFLYVADEKAARGGVDYLKAQGSNAIKVWYIEREGQTPAERAALIRAAGEEAKKQGLPLIVHATELDGAKDALRAGATLLVHSVWDKPVDQEFLDLLKSNGAVYCPTLTVPRGYQKMNEAALAKKAPVPDDPNHCVDPVTLGRLAETATIDPGVKQDVLVARRERLAQREWLGAANLKRVAAGGIPIAMGTDAGNPLTLHGPAVYAEMEAMQAAGLTPMEVLVASTRGSARALGREKDLGTVEKGKQADLLILGADPTADIENVRQVRSVMRGGALRSIAELSALATTPPQDGGEE
jgi:imidazolonepropionase-like amidohydrolase